MQLTDEKAAYIEAKLKQFKLVDMREQYSDIIREAEENSMDYLEFFMRLINAEDEGKNNRRTEKLLAKAGFNLPSRLDDIDYSFNPSLVHTSSSVVTTLLTRQRLVLVHLLSFRLHIR